LCQKEYQLNGTVTIQSSVWSRTLTSMWCCVRISTRPKHEHWELRWRVARNIQVLSGKVWI